MREEDFADGSRVMHNGSVRDGFLCISNLQAPTRSFEKCSAAIIV